MIEDLIAAYHKCNPVKTRYFVCICVAETTAMQTPAIDVPVLAG